MRRHRASAQPRLIIVSQRAPLRITPNESAAYTWSTWMFCQMYISPSTAEQKSSAWQASVAALMAPAEVPAITWNGLPSVAQASRRNCAIAASTPT